MRRPTLLILTFIFAAALRGTYALANSGIDNEIAFYPVQPGDLLAITVWKEDNLSQQVIVRPDGYITFPLAGETLAAGGSIEALRLKIADRLKKYIPDPVVTVSVLELSGNTIYVLGQVNRPGVFPMSRNTDIVQALSMAGGASTYASLNSIKILRRENGDLHSIPFKYGDIEKGKNLEQNIILKAGDVVVVP